MKKLEDLAEVMVGQIMTRVASKDEEGPEVRVLVPGAVEAGYINEKSLGTNHLKKDLKKEFNPKFYTKAGDLVMKLTADYDVALVKEGQEGIAISSFICVIRPKNTDAAFLCAVLNSDYVKNDLRSKADGAMRPMLKVSDIRDLEIPLIKEEDQKGIGEAYILSLEKIQTLQQLKDTETDLMKAVVNNVIRKGIANV